MRATGEQLKEMLEYLRGLYPNPTFRDMIAKSLPSITEELPRLLAYAHDQGWIVITDKAQNIELGPYRLIAQGIDKLNAWTGDDDVTEI